MAELAHRLADNPAVIGFDSLNEPSPGFIGRSMSQPQFTASRESPIPVRAGPCWTPFSALRVARGETVEIPVLAPGEDGMQVVGREIANPGGVPIWLPGVTDPFEQAGAWRLCDGKAEVLDEDFFRKVGGRAIDPDTGLMLPFFHAVAETIRTVRPEWLLFAEMNPYQFGQGRGFPPGMPARSVNASHWYDVDILWRKTLDRSATKGQLRTRYRAELAQIHATGNLAGAPKLVGEFGIPFDLDEGRAFALWAADERDESIWESHATALSLMYDAMDTLLLSSTQWNYTATNSNDLRIGDGWNQEDLSIFSPEQLENGDGARGRKGFSRPYVMRAQGRIAAMRFDDEIGTFEAVIDADPAIGAPTEIFIPEAHFPHGIAVTVEPADCRWEFARAIAQSGGGRDEGVSLSIAETKGKAFAAGAGVAGDDLAALRAIPADKVRGNMTLMNSEAATYSGPMIDGRLVRERTDVAFLAGHQAPVPYLVGANSYEIGFAPEAMRKPFTAMLGVPLGAAQAGVKSAYGSPEAYERNLAGDAMFVEPARFLAGLNAANGSYLYLFDYVPEGRRALDLGAPHGSEVAFVFGTLGTLGVPAMDADRATSRLVGDYWTAFAKAGDPNGNGRANWPAHEPGSHSRMVFSATGGTAGSAASPALDALGAFADAKREADLKKGNK
jgi:hypothetical protein